MDFTPEEWECLCSAHRTQNKDVALENCNNLLFVENHLISGMHGKVVDKFHDHVNVQEQFSKWDKIRKMTLESTQSTPCQTNHHDDSHQYSNLKKWKTVKSRGVCKYENCIMNSNECTISTVNEGIHIDHLHTKVI